MTDGSQRRRRPGASAFLAAAAMVFAIATVPARAQGDDQRARVEGAFLVNFIRFTEWPPGRFRGHREPYVLVVVGSRDVASAIREIADSAGTVQGRRIAVHQVDGDELFRRRDVLRDSHLVFVDRTGGVAARDVVGILGGTSVLTVGDSAGFVRAGGMLALVASGARVGFVANPEAIRNARLSVSAKVLKLAQDTTP